LKLRRRLQLPPDSKTIYVMLLRGINVGDRNLIGMPELKSVLQGLGLDVVCTYIQSSNVVFRSGRSSAEIARETGNRVVEGVQVRCRDDPDTGVIARRLREGSCAHTPEGGVDDSEGEAMFGAQAERGEVHVGVAAVA
jgi:hypothetical protein